MADTAPTSSVFTFLAVRPPRPPDPVSERLRTMSDPRAEDASALFEVATAWDPEGEEPERVRGDVLAVVKRRGLEPTLTGGAQSDGLTRLDDSLTRAGAGAAERDRLEAAVVDAFDLSPADLVDSDAFREVEGTLWDAYVAHLVLQRFRPVDLGPLTRGLRLTHLVRQLAADDDPVGTAWLDAVLSAVPLVPSRYTVLPKAPVPQQPEPAEEPDRRDELRALWNRVVDTHEALRSVRSLGPAFEESTSTRTVTVTDDKGEVHKAKQTQQRMSPVTGERLHASLPTATRTVLGRVGLEAANLTVADATDRLGAELDRLVRAVDAETSPQLLEVMPQKALSIPGLTALANRNIVAFTPILPFLPKSIRRSIKPLGVGDLKVVKQRLRAYVPGEVAHIENVLRGEYRERKHRVLDRSEEMVTTSLETTEETTRDTQTTDRFELKKEVSKEVSEQLSVSAGVTVSGSYGPVTFGAHGDFAYSTSTNQSEKTASNFAREVVDKAVTRVEKKTRNERVSKTLHEVEEVNTHGIDNKGQPDHVTGVYRWVDKHYEAQIFNYGKRLMLEFVVPEPGAFYDHAVSRESTVDIPPPKPLPEGLGPEDMDGSTYRIYARDHDVDGLTPPPPEWKSISLTLASQASIANGTTTSVSSKELVVPDGYRLSHVGVSTSFVYENHPQVKLSVGTDLAWYDVRNNAARRRADWTAGVANDLTPGPVPVSLVMYDINGYFVNVVGWCSRTPQAWEQWQMTTYRAIVAAHAAQVRAWEEKVRTAQARQQGAVVIEGRNPRANEEIVRGELKKQCVQMLMDTWQFASYDAMKETSDGPLMDIVDAEREGRQIQFFEQAFEWSNMTFLFYPYYWGRRSEWEERLLADDPDPQFAAFRRSGAARVVVPAHTAYNDAVMHFLETDGSIWNGGEAPRLDDPLFVSLADELRGRTDDLQNAEPEGEPWEVVLPTTLVWLQQDSTLPTFA